MSRPHGSKNKRTKVREAHKANPDKLNGIALLDSLDVMEEAMSYFQGLAREARAELAGEMEKPKPNAETVNKLKEHIRTNYQDAVAMAKEVAPYRHSRLAAIKIAKPDDDEELRNKTFEQLRTELMESFERLRLFDNIPIGIAYQPSPDDGS